MQPWLLPIDDSSSGRKPSHWLTEEILAKHLALVENSSRQSNGALLEKANRSSVESYDAFTYFDEDMTHAEALDAKDSQEPENRVNRAKADTRLDLKTFCLLFDRLILVYNV